MEFLKTLLGRLSGKWSILVYSQVWPNQLILTLRICCSSLSTISWDTLYSKVSFKTSGFLNSSRTTRDIKMEFSNLLLHFSVYCCVNLVVHIVNIGDEIGSGEKVLKIKYVMPLTRKSITLFLKSTENLKTKSALGLNCIVFGKKIKIILHGLEKFRFTQKRHVLLKERKSNVRHRIVCRFRKQGNYVYWQDVFKKVYNCTALYLLHKINTYLEWE